MFRESASELCVHLLYFNVMISSRRKRSPWRTEMVLAFADDLREVSPSLRRRIRSGLLIICHSGKAFLVTRVRNLFLVVIDQFQQNFDSSELFRTSLHRKMDKLGVKPLVDESITQKKSLASCFHTRDWKNVWLFYLT